MKLPKIPIALGVGVLALAGCEYPTDAPQIEQRWILAVESTTFGVDELLPSGVTVSGGNFVVSVDPFNTSEDLGTLCAACLANDLTTAPKPAFENSFSVDQSLPGDVSQVETVSGSIAVVLSHNLGFDPIQPPGGAAGSLTITVRNGPSGSSIGQLVLDGATESFPSGMTVTRTIQLSQATLGNTISLDVSVDSPAGDATDPANWVPINVSNSFTASATPSGILVSSAKVNVANQTVSFDPQDVNTEDVDEAFTDRIQQGALILEFSNPFGVSVSGTVELGPTSKAMNIPASATSKVTINYTGDELRSFLGKSGVQFSGGGTVSAAGPITVTPGQVVTLKASLDFTIIVG